MEIVQAWDGRLAECGAVNDRVGLIAADEAIDEAADLVATLACEVKRSRPQTPAGLRASAERVERQAEAAQQHGDVSVLFAATVAAFGATA